MVILLKYKLLFHKEINPESDDSLQMIIDDLKNKLDWLHAVPIDDLLEFVEEFGKSINSHSKTDFASTSKHISDFFTKSNLKQELNLALRGNYKILDSFVKLENGGDKLFHTQPRGLAVHWIAGNVDELGIFSIIQALISKNVSLIKAPSNYENLLKMINLLKETKTDKLSGIDIVETLSVIYLDKDDEENQTIISEAADIRIIWGGLDAVTKIISFSKKSFCEDIVFGPKYSYAIIDEESISDSNLPVKLAFDISIFDQNACSSPHTIFIETKNKELVHSFAEKLSLAMDKVNKLIPKQPISESKSMEIHEIRSENEFLGTVFSSKDTSWTIIISDDSELAKPYFSRIIFIKPISDAMEIATSTKKIQTVGIMMNKNKRLELIDKLTLQGGDRSPSIGDMSTYENPWDGMFVLDRLVRWISTYD